MSISSEPKLVDYETNRNNSDKALIRQLQEYHGVGAVVPNNQDGTTAIRFNLDTKKLEYKSGSKWEEIKL